MITLKAAHRDGAGVAAKTALMQVEGPARAVLAAERTALNLLGHLSGIATATHAFVRLIQDMSVQATRTRICCTRKTTPGLRSLEKYAVRCGGGANHRLGLDDAVLIKDNHIAVAGGIRAVLERARRHAGHLVKIEIEVDDLTQLREVLATGLADAMALLDNMAPDVLRQAVALRDAATRACRARKPSGGITLDTIAAVAATGVDYASSGWITHSAPNLDVALDIEMLASPSPEGRVAVVAQRRRSGGVIKIFSGRAPLSDTMFFGRTPRSHTTSTRLASLGTLHLMSGLPDMRKFDDEVR